MLSEQGFVSRNPKKLYKLDRFEQISGIRNLSIFDK